MRDEIKRDKRMELRLSEREKAYIETKFEASKMKHMSDYIRCQAMFGKVFYIDMTLFDFLKKQVSGACANINQIARVANQTAGISEHDIEEIKQLKRLTEDTFKEINGLKNAIEQRLWQ